MEHCDAWLVVGELRWCYGASKLGNRPDKVKVVLASGQVDKIVGVSEDMKVNMPHS